jgi:hypothetical protein
MRFSSTLLAGRGATAPNEAVSVGLTVTWSMPASAKTAWANSNQLHQPALVRW